MTMWPAEFGNSYILKYEIKDDKEIPIPSAWKNEHALTSKEEEVASRNVAREVMRMDVS